MTLNLTFWMMAWILMGVTFVAATGAILLGAKGLDRENPNPTPPKTNSAPDSN